MIDTEFQLHEEHQGTDHDSSWTNHDSCIRPGWQVEHKQTTKCNDVIGPGFVVVFSLMLKFSGPVECTVGVRQNYEGKHFSNSLQISSCV